MIRLVKKNMSYTILDKYDINNISVDKIIEQVILLKERV